MIKTVDAFQGQEKDIVIINCVRSNNYKGLGFVTDLRRINVAITRPRYFLIVVGNSKTLSNSLVWKKFIKSCQDNQAFYQVTSATQ